MHSKVKKRLYRNIAIYSAVALLLIIFNMMDGLVRTRRMERQEVESQLEEIAWLEADVINNYMGDLLRRVRIGSFAFEKMSQLVSPQSEELIHNKLNRVDSATLFLVTPDQEIHYVEGQYLDALSQMDFTQGFTGKESISGVQHLDGQSNSAFVVITVPIWQEGEVAGLLGGVYPTHELAQALDFSCFNGQGYAHLIQSDGQFVIRSSHTGAADYDKSFFELEQQQFSKGYSFEQMVEMIQQRQSGIIHFSNGDGVERYACLVPTGINDWYIVSVVTKEALNAHADLSIGLEVQMIVKNMVILGVYFVIVYCQRERADRETRQMLEDLTRAHAQLQASEERFKLAASHSNGLILEYRRGEEGGRIISYNETGGQILPEKSDVENLDWKGLIHPDDYARSRAISRQILAGRKSVKEVLRLRSRAVPEENCRREVCPRWTCDGRDCPEKLCAGPGCLAAAEKPGEKHCDPCMPPPCCPGRYRWYQITVTALDNKDRDNDGSILITLEDMDAQYQEKEALEILARQDSLTGLLNRAASEQAVTARLKRMEKGEQAGFLLLDLDDFKAVNDRLGHHMGDQVLREFAKQLKRQFRESDPVGRLGGDEFMVFVANLSDPEVIRRKTLELNQAVDRWSARMHWADRSLFSISVGAVFAEAGDNFQLLYRRADAALYRSKNQGKRRCSFYNESAVPADKS